MTSVVTIVYPTQPGNYYKRTGMRLNLLNSSWLLAHTVLCRDFLTQWVFNLMSVLAFYSIMMTYFGVNFYLTGLHSYASGDKVVTPNFVYYSLAIVAVLAIISYLKYKKHLKK